VSDAPPVTLADWMRNIGKRLTVQERRPNLQPRVEALEGQTPSAMPRIRMIRGSGTLTLTTGSYTLLGGTDVWTTSGTGARAARGGIIVTDDRDITVPVDGDYLVELGVCTGTAGAATMIVVKKNNTSLNGNGRILWQGAPGNVGSVSWNSVSAVIPLEEGDVLTPSVYATGSAVIDGSGTPSFWGVRLIEAD